MKKLLAAIVLVLACLPVSARSLVILHTNDTHSHIDAQDGVGGVFQRKVLIDSVRSAEPEVMLIDAGDAVQGSLYYKLFGGDVEFPLMDMMGYDIQILGNHEFDNGIDELATRYKKEGPVKLASNYDFTGTPLAGVFQPYYIKDVGGKKVGFMALNLDPDGMLSPGTYGGMGFKDIIQTANHTAELLRKKGCKTVVAVTHIGYTNDSHKPLVTDVDLAKHTRGIDLIIGGHSHEVIVPGNLAAPNIFLNLDGEPVTVAQTGRYGERLGYVKLDLSGRKPRIAQLQMIPVTGQDSTKFDKAMVDFVTPYRHKVDSVNARPVATLTADLPNRKEYASSAGISNMVADMALLRARSAVQGGGDSKIDLAMINSGGIRLPWKKGTVTEGQIMSTFPFTNHLVTVEVTGKKLTDIVQQALEQGGQGFSRTVSVSYTLDGKGKKHIKGLLIDGEPVNPGDLYRLATLDYLQGGGDYMDELKDTKPLWTDEWEMYQVVLHYLGEYGNAGVPLVPDMRPRIVPAI